MTVVTERPAQTPEGVLIQKAAERTRQSARQLAANAGISDTRWRHIVNGYQPVGAGVTIAIVAPADRLARMARAVGVTADELRRVGRADAAEELESMAPERGDGATAEDVVDELVDQIWASNIPEDTKRKLIKVLIRGAVSNQAMAAMSERLRDEQESA